jgi:hypothetical protein
MTTEWTAELRWRHRTPYEQGGRDRKPWASLVFCTTQSRCPCELFFFIVVFVLYYILLYVLYVLVMFTYCRVCGFCCAKLFGVLSAFRRRRFARQLPNHSQLLWLFPPTAADVGGFNDKGRKLVLDCNNLLYCSLRRHPDQCVSPCFVSVSLMTSALHPCKLESRACLVASSCSPSVPAVCHAYCTWP